MVWGSLLRILGVGFRRFRVQSLSFWGFGWRGLGRPGPLGRTFYIRFGNFGAWMLRFAMFLSAS